MTWPDGQAAKTTPSHGVNPGSIPGQVMENKHVGACFFIPVFCLDLLFVLLFVLLFILLFPEFPHPSAKLLVPISFPPSQPPYSLL